MKKSKHGMTSAIELDKYRVKENPAIEIPFVDMLFDKGKRQAMYEKYDEMYEETAEEREIFEAMVFRGRERDK